TFLVSRRWGTRNAGNLGSTNPSISDDGHWVAFESRARDLVENYVVGAGTVNVFAAYSTVGNDVTTYLVSSRRGSPLIGANGSSSDVRIAGAPNANPTSVQVAYTTEATDVGFDAADGSMGTSVYRRRLLDNAATLVSRATGVAG